MLELFGIVSHTIAGVLIQKNLNSLEALVAGDSEATMRRGIVLSNLPDLDALTQIPLHTYLLTAGYEVYDTLLHQGYLVEKGVPESLREACSYFCHKSEITHSLLPGFFVPVLGSIALQREKDLAKMFYAMGGAMVHYGMHLLFDMMHGDIKPFPFHDPALQWSITDYVADRTAYSHDVVELGLQVGMYALLASSYIMLERIRKG